MKHLERRRSDNLASVSPSDQFFAKVPSGHVAVMLRSTHAQAG